MNINVGQIVYLLSKKEIKVYPAQVIEEINRKTLFGSETSYVIKLPDKSGTEVHVDQIDADIFTSAKDLENTMMENAKSKIHNLIENAKSMESMFENIVYENLDSNILEEEVDEKAVKPKRKRRRSKPKDKPSEKKITVDLGNGVTGKIDMESINLAEG